MTKTILKNSPASIALCVGMTLGLSIQPAVADQVFLDDVIVDGSLCVGLDCINGETFGFDTIRMKENNLRIKAQDTSNSASFPSTDWQLTFNDSVNGGANKFSIEDVTASRVPFTITGGAPNHSLFVSSTGNVGVGTSTPVTDIHAISGNTPTLRLQQNGSSGFAPQIFDVAANETNFFIRDATNGSTLPFRMRPGAPSNSIFVNEDGDIGMGTASPAQPLHVTRTDNSIALVESTNSGATQLRLHSDNVNNRRIVAADFAGTPLTQIAFGDTNLKLFGVDIATPWLTVDATGITTTGAGACNPGPCDRTFDPEYFEVPSIDEHAAFMWENKYLWGVGPTKEGDPINLTKKTTGILHELEKAHIYIEQLHDRLKSVEAELQIAQK